MKDEKAGEEIVARLKLDVKALTLLYDSDSDLGPVVERAFLESQDLYVARFLALLKPRRPSDEGSSLPVALGEIVLASFLAIVGLAAFVPDLARLSSPQQWANYFSSAISPSVQSGPLYFGVPLLDFGFSAVLLLGAFHTLRRAAKGLKDAGMVLPG